MKTATTGAQVTIRASGVLLIILGVTFWTGHALQLIPLHEFLGLLLVLSLWTLAGIAGTLWGLARCGCGGGSVGLIAPALGLTQDRILVGSWHWTIQVLHLLIGLGAIGQGEGLTQRLRQATRSTQQLAGEA